RFRHRYRAPSRRSRSALLRLDRTLMARTSFRSALDTCPNTAPRFATRPALCSVSRESFWFDGSCPLFISTHFHVPPTSQLSMRQSSFASQRLLRCLHHFVLKTLRLFQLGPMTRVFEPD